MTATNWMAGCASLLLPWAANAHHSPAAYDLTAELTVEGVVVAVDWRNPHIYVTLEVAGLAGPRIVTIESDGIAAVQTSGLEREVLAPGTRVAIRGYPNRRDEDHLLGVDLAARDGAIYPLGPRGRSTQRAATVAPATGLAGKWAPTPASFRALATAARTWPFTAAALAAATDIASTLAAAGGCTPPYTQPTLMGLHVLRTIDVAADAVTVRIDGMDEAVRTVHLGLHAHPADVEPSLLGHSIGRWENGALLIDTVGFEPARQGIAFGIPSSAAKHMTEKLSLTADARALQYEFTLEDPEYLASPVSFAMLWEHRPDLELSGGCDPAIARRFLDEARALE